MVDNHPYTSILEYVKQTPGCTLDDVILGCPGLTWNEVFAEIDRLSRTGRIRLHLAGRGIYRLEAQHDCAATPTRPLSTPEHLRRPQTIVEANIYPQHQIGDEMTLPTQRLPTQRPSPKPATGGSQAVWINSGKTRGVGRIETASPLGAQPHEGSAAMRGLQRLARLIDDPVLPPDKFVFWHRYAKAKHPPMERTQCPICRCHDGLSPWPSVVPWLENFGLSGITFMAGQFQVPPHLVNRVYRLIAGKGAWV